MSDLAGVLGAFRERLGGEPEVVVRAPGRVNLIGEHTDYNDGFVLPMAIDRTVWVVLRPRSDRSVRVHALDFGAAGAFELDGLERGEGWLEYVKGVAWALQEAGYSLAGWEGVLGGDVPLGSGLSSSAAVELATLRAFHEVSGFPWDEEEMARLGQRAENGWVGANTGIMDQLISAAGREGYALLIDCRTLATEPVTLPPNTAVVVMDTATRHSHTDSGYNERRAECEAAASHYRVPALRDLTLERLEAGAAGLPEPVYRRARHVVTENARTLEAAEALREGDATTMGRLMNESHDSLRDDFDVTTDALNKMVECAREQDACYGARMTGGGFGGSAVALVEEPGAAAFMEAVAACYEADTGLSPALYLCHAAAGASTLTP